MIIEISGMQRVGKSTLIEGLTFNFNLYKFPMGGFCKRFGVQPTWEMQMAKDISMLEFYSQVVKCSEADDIPTITDRGPLSTIFYSILFKRASLDQIKDFVEYLANYRTDWHPVWIEATNQPVMTREKDDGFDKLQSNLDPVEVVNARETMFNILNEHNIHPCHFLNNFENPIEKNQDLFQHAILEIYGDR